MLDGACPSSDIVNAAELVWFAGVTMLWLTTLALCAALCSLVCSASCWLLDLLVALTNQFGLLLSACCLRAGFQLLVHCCLSVMVQVHGCLPLSGGAFCCPLTLLCPIGTWSCVDLLCCCSRCNV